MPAARQEIRLIANREVVGLVGRRPMTTAKDRLDLGGRERNFGVAGGKDVTSLSGPFRTAGTGRFGTG